MQGEWTIEKELTPFGRAVIENHAQLIRFVQRKQMTSDEAAKLAIEHAVALLDAVEQFEEETR